MPFAAPPDLVITEFSDDASGFDPESVQESYGELADLFASVGSDWAILSPGYVRPGPTSPCSFWMLGMEEENGLLMEDDPRPYTKVLRAFVSDRAFNSSSTSKAGHAGRGVALADAALLWGRLYRQGVPCTCAMHTHPTHTPP